MWMVPGSYRWGDQIEFIREHMRDKEFEDFQRITAPFTPPAGAEVTAAIPQPWPMKEFVEVEDGGLMAAAGAHFPIVCRDGEPLGTPPQSDNSMT